MKYTKVFVGLAMAIGMAALPAAAQDVYRGRDIRNDQRDLHRDYERVARLRADIARDEYQLREDRRYGRTWKASRDAADLARDRRALESLERDIRHDRRDLHRDYRGY